MKIERVTSPHVAEPPPGRWSNALRVGDMLFISGMVSRASDGRTIEGRDEYEQAKVIFGKIRSLVEAAGGAMADVRKGDHLRREHQEQYRSVARAAGVL